MIMITRSPPQELMSSSGGFFRGHSKSTFAQNFQFLTSPPLLVPSCSFYMQPSPPLTQVRFSELHPPLRKSSAILRRLFRIKNRGVKREKRIILFVNLTWRRIEILFEKKPSLHKKFRSIYREVLSVTWPNFRVVKYNSKISIIYHQEIFGKV